VNPVEMSREVISTVSYSFEPATYSTPQLQRLFSDWLSEIEREFLEFIDDRDNVDSDEVARHFRLERESAVFIMSKLAQEGKINIQASGNPATIRVRSTC
jgi:hypothetical protein